MIKKQKFIVKVEPANMWVKHRVLFYGISFTIQDDFIGFTCSWAKKYLWIGFEIWNLEVEDDE